MSVNRNRMRGLSGASRSRGFSMVELMVAMVLGLIVVAAVVNLVMSIIQSNNQTIQATRLTQELRATAQVIASDIKRARSVDDPFRNPTVVGGNPYRAIQVVEQNGANGRPADCVRYAYFNSDAGVTTYFHSISRSNNSVLLASGTTAALAACSTGERLNSPFINISDLDIASNGRRITITLTGSLVDNPSIQRTLTQTIFIRSLAGS